MNRIGPDVVLVGIPRASYGRGMTTTPRSGADGGRRSLTPAILDGFRSRLRGGVVLPGDPGFADACRIWNAMVAHRPALVVCCEGVADVQQSVRFAAEHGMPIAVRGGGHHIGGRALAEGGLTIDLSGHREVGLTPEGIVEVGPGATLAQLDAATLPQGRVVPSGIVSETGVAGLTLGGGFGWLTRRFGLTCDHLDEVEIVMADGEVRRVTERADPELMWALRGGGGGFGVVTRFRFRSRAMDPSVIAGPMVRPRAEAEDAIERFRRCSAEAPDELTSLLKLGVAPAAPFLPTSLHGQPVAFLIVCHGGGEAAARRDLAVLRDGTPPVADLAQPRAFQQFQAMFDGGEPKGRRNYWKSEYVTEFDDAIATVLLEALDRLPSAAANIKVFQLGGAVSRTAVGATAAGHRDARFIIVVASAWEGSEDDARNVSWVRDAWQRVHACSGRGGYLNFLTDDVSEAERVTAHGGVDLERLAAIRRRHDPHGLFRTVTARGGPGR